MDAQDQNTQLQESHATADCLGGKSLSEQQGSKCTNQSGIRGFGQDTAPLQSITKKPIQEHENLAGVEVWW